MEPLLELLTHNYESLVPFPMRLMFCALLRGVLPAKRPKLWRLNG